MTVPLRDFAATLTCPRLRAPSGLGAPGARRDALVLLGFHLAVLLLVLSPLLKVWQTAMGLPAPEAFGAVSKGWLVPLVVLVAPVLEEFAFRGWLTGRPGALWLLGCGLVMGGLLAMVGLHVAEVAASFGFIAMVLAALGGWWRLRHRAEPPAWFVAAFPALFYLSIAAFGLSHLSNYPQVSLALLPMVLPQLWTGLLLSFVRMRIGLVAAMLIHAAANGTAISLALLSGG